MYTYIFINFLTSLNLKVVLKEKLTTDRQMLCQTTSSIAWPSAMCINNKLFLSSVHDGRHTYSES